MMMIQAAALTNPSNKLRAAMYQVIYSVGGVADLMLGCLALSMRARRRRCVYVVTKAFEVMGGVNKRSQGFSKKDPDTFTVFNVNTG